MLGNIVAGLTIISTSLGNIGAMLGNLGVRLGSAGAMMGNIVAGLGNGNAGLALIDAKADQNTLLQEISSDTAGSFNAVEYPNFTISNPPTQTEVQALFDLVVAILDAGRRA